MSHEELTGGELDPFGIPRDPETIKLIRRKAREYLDRIGALIVASGSIDEPPEWSPGPDHRNYLKSILAYALFSVDKDEKPIIAEGLIVTRQLAAGFFTRKTGLNYDAFVAAPIFITDDGEPKIDVSMLDPINKDAADAFGVIRIYEVGSPALLNSLVSSPDTGETLIRLNP